MRAGRPSRSLADLTCPDRGLEAGAGRAAVHLCRCQLFCLCLPKRDGQSCPSPGNNSPISRATFQRRRSCSRRPSREIAQIGHISIRTTVCPSRWMIQFQPPRSNSPPQGAPLWGV